MVDFDTAVAAVQDPNADPVLLAKIAYENPEFGANVVVNPRAYPGLKRWIAEFGDERARQQLAAMGWPVPQEVPDEQAGFTAEFAMTTTDQMLMARIASEVPELRPCLARNPNIYPELLTWLEQLNDSAINAAIRLRQ